MKKWLILALLAIVAVCGFLYLNAQQKPKYVAPTIFTLVDGTLQSEVESQLGQPLSIEVDAERVHDELEQIYEQILSTNAALNTDASQEKRALLEEILSVSSQNIDLVAMRYKVVEKTPDGDNEFVRTLYFYNGKLILNQ
ncbi:hypothetical protein G7062_01115 [Erysipelothrix sp. HDW6C]|uniref:hypothetical protein n=1 Tax=Erysipelothrix sp. HDW6C TaxID=2714930 RepID=UPI00140BB1E8|nr:hypothetical protein [Erysipelothrix sp. HDW6C]QIK68965.1 hypothetical protein G7062_01115 [Erysipelothrix sp. HDW6C]